MKYLKFLSVGIFFGILLVKSEAVSWFRIFEMFRFESFHMYGIIGSAVALGAIGIALIKKFKLKDLSARPLKFLAKRKIIPLQLLVDLFLGWVGP